jgi:hypothetical protein
MKAKHINSFFSLSFREKMLFSEAFFFHLIVGLLLKVVRFKWIPRIFAGPERKGADYDTSVGGQVKRFTQYASMVSPWKNKCLVQSLAARWMLNRRKIPSQLSLGVAFDQNRKMIAHAWLKIFDFEVVEQSGNYQELFLF